MASITSAENIPTTSGPSLPAKLVSLIAQYTDAKTLYNLSLASKSMRNAVYTIPTIRALIERQVASVWEGWSWSIDKLALRADGDVKIWFKYAMADYVSAAGLTTGMMMDEAIPMLAELAILGHPVCQLSLLFRDDNDTADDLCVQFLYARNIALLALLQQSLWVPDEVSNQPVRVSIYPDDLDISIQDSLHIIWGTITSWFNINKAMHKLDEEVPDAWTSISLPLPNRLPFDIAASGEHSNFPTPYDKDWTTGAAWMSWEASYSLAMYTTSFLFDGEWQGFCGQSDGREGELPIRRIRFLRSDEVPTYDYVPVTAVDCLENYDVFDLDGRMIRGTSSTKLVFNMRNRLQPGCPTHARLKMTPFGLVGFRKEMFASSFEPIWLWKKEWSQPVGA